MDVDQESLLKFFRELPFCSPGQERQDFWFSEAAKTFDPLKTANTAYLVPAGPDKTIIALLVALAKARFGLSRTLYLAPMLVFADPRTRPQIILDNLLENFVRYRTNTKEMEPVLWKWSAPHDEIVFADPDTALNSFSQGTLKLEDFSLAIFDEIDRARKSYPYVKLAELITLKGSRILGLSASLGKVGQEEEIRRNCFLGCVLHSGASETPVVSQPPVTFELPAKLKFGFRPLLPLRAKSRRKKASSRQLCLDFGEQGF